MSESNPVKPQIKLAYTAGLKEVVLNELKKSPKFHIVDQEDEEIYLEFRKEQLADIKKLRSVARVYVTIKNEKYHPLYLSTRKSILGNLIELVIRESAEKFKSFKIYCAGSHTPEVRGIAKYIQETYGLEEKEEADLKIHIIKPEVMWEIAVQITPRPLSMRDYKEKNMSGAMDPTVADAINSFCELDKAKTYLNVFSGSATLLIEAGLSYPNLERLIGFDNDKKHLSLAIQNIKKAGLIKKILVKEGDIYDKPDFGMFDAITADLPFGMAISKGENLEKLYKSFIEYCHEKLNPEGKLVIYTSEYLVLERVIAESKFKIIKSLEIKSMTAANVYLQTKIFVCEPQSV